MSVTVRAKLPRGDHNGLTHLEAHLAANPDELVVVVAMLGIDTIEHRPHDDENPRLVKTVLLHVEAINGTDADAAEKMLRATYQARTGKAELPFEEGNGE